MNAAETPAQALRLLHALVERERWSEFDIEDGHRAIEQSPLDAVLLFTEMMARHPGSTLDHDERVRCADCTGLRGELCTRHMAAGLLTAVIGPELAALPQRCPVFKERERSMEVDDGRA